MLDLLETFLAVSEAGSLNKAAEVLHLTQPAITRQIRALEGQLGAVLLHRTSHGVTLTPAGIAVLPHARQAIAAATACRHAAREAAAGRAKRLTLATGLMVTLYVLPPVVAEFRTQHADVDVELRPGTHAEAIQRLLAYQVDAAVIASDVHVPQVRPIPIFRDPLLLISAPRESTSSGEDGTLQALQGKTLLVPSPQTGLRHQIERALAARQVAVHLAEHPTAETIKTSVALGMGLAILPHSVVAEDVAAGRLTARAIADWTDAARTVRVLVRAEGAISEPVRALVALLREHYHDGTAGSA